ncbi:MAG: PIG-X/PBN1 family protein [Proteobacteria bacterium]|nr:PIG-X/PBN1 family protein [Pseudomonadota bacterium]
MAKILTLSIVVLVAGCVHDAWQHQTLRGTQAQSRLEVDKKQCQEMTLQPLPAAVYVDTYSGFIYESQNGPSRGITRSAEAAAKGHPRPALASQVQNKPYSLHSIENKASEEIFHTCMASKGWTNSARQQRGGREAADPGNRHVPATSPGSTPQI